ncbi:hypothetical protein STRIP9103_03923 [Streptomyces ipomoeae 91-03]|uniref:Uncharacterized protein n=1 Tax=Streptomyces ipomoeae 91-03 TaxID=698759 RepID=L1L7D7_9ACTN|nr:hypothetical protein STRIP9103_03923 [Streptomyces ipomoeae 91-03]
MFVGLAGVAEGSPCSSVSPVSPKDRRTPRSRPCLRRIAVLLGLARVSEGSPYSSASPAPPKGRRAPPPRPHARRPIDPLCGAGDAAMRRCGRCGGAGGAGVRRPAPVTAALIFASLGHLAGPSIAAAVAE